MAEVDLALTSMHDKSRVAIKVYPDKVRTRRELLLEFLHLHVPWRGDTRPSLREVESFLDENEPAQGLISARMDVEKELVDLCRPAIPPFNVRASENDIAWRWATLQVKDSTDASGGRPLNLDGGDSTGKKSHAGSGTDSSDDSVDSDVEVDEGPPADNDGWGDDFMPEASSENFGGQDGQSAALRRPVLPGVRVDAETVRLGRRWLEMAKVGPKANGEGAGSASLEDAEREAPRRSLDSLMHMLNPEQRKAFLIITAAVVGSREVPPLRMILTGAGGTGKSFLLMRLQQWMEWKYGRSNPATPWIAVVAVTGRAALNVQGITVARAFAMGRRKKLGGETLSDDAPLKCALFFSKAKLVFLDEYSLLDGDTCDFVHDRLHAVAPHAHVVLAGDVHQLPPVAARGGLLWKAPSRTGLLNAYYAQYKTVVILVTGKRFDSDPVFGEILARLRTRTSTEDDLRILNAQCASKSREPDPLHPGKFLVHDREATDSGRLHIFGTHAARHLLNQKCLDELPGSVIPLNWRHVGGVQRAKGARGRPCAADAAALHDNVIKDAARQKELCKRAPSGELD